MKFGVVLGLSYALRGAADSCLANPESCAKDDMSVLQIRQEKPRIYRASDFENDRYNLAGKSVYLLMTDRFDRVGGYSSNNLKACEGNDWCNGTFAGIKEQLPYIHGMGFDCIWVTPVVKNPAVEDKGPDTTCGGSGWGYHGYWAEDYYSTDPHFGTNSELKELVAAVHDIGMCFVLDIVTNHMGPIHPFEPLRVDKKKPFDLPEYYHRRDIGNQTWDEYTAKYCDWPSPAQAMGAGTLCRLDTDKAGKPDYTNGGNYCNCYKPANGPYNEKNYLGKDAAGPKSLKYCGPGNYCEGYNQELIWEGWFYDLGDLNHSHPFVLKTQLKYMKWLRKEFDIDSIRLDTAPFMPWDVLTKLQKAAWPVQIHGEVTTTNISFHASFQKYEGKKVLEGLENFPAFYAASAGYCGDAGVPSSPTAMWNLRELSSIMQEQIDGPYTCIDSLMNFMDNQDTSPMANTCKSDEVRMKNSLTWVFFSYGIPTVTWGTEVGNTEYRNSLWQYGWKTDTWEYGWIKTLNSLRKKHHVRFMKTRIAHATKSKLSFVRYRRHVEVWVFTTSKNEESKVKYDAGIPQKPKCCKYIWWIKSCGWVNAFTGKKPVIKGGKLIAKNSEPVVLVASLSHQAAKKMAAKRRKLQIGSEALLAA